MALLGSGFNSSDPSDDDLVKYGASWIRDVKARLKSFVGVLFNPDTGQLKDNVIAPAKLTSLSPDPSGAYNWGTVNDKGLVTSGQDVGFPGHGRLITEIFLGDAIAQSAVTPVGAAGAALRWDPNGNTFYSEVLSEFIETGGPGGDSEGTATHWSARVLWTVPDGVSQVKATVLAGGGGGQGGGSQYGGAGGSFASVNFLVAPGQQWELWVGSGGLGGVSADGWAGTMSRMYLDGYTYARVKGGNGGTSAAPGTIPWPMSPFGNSHGETYIGTAGYGIPGQGTLGGAAGNGTPGGVDEYYFKQHGAGGAGAVTTGNSGGVGVITLEYVL